ncbi:hypothetical protein D3C80_801620 [compost metagenome]
MHYYSAIDLNRSKWSAKKPTGKPRIHCPARLNFAQHYFNLAFIPIFSVPPDVA